MNRNLYLLYMLAWCCLSTSPAFSQTISPTLAERLGYPPDTKLLIIHADDLGMAYALNQASFQSLNQGSVSSASIMMPCPWVGEVAAFAQANQHHDLGLHLTLTSEWNFYKWGPVASRDTVSSLVDKNGYFYNNCDSMAAHARPEEVERELRAQIEQAKTLGIQPTHFDTHMGCLYWTNQELLKIYLKLGREYKVPLRMGRSLVKALPDSLRQLVAEKDIVIDQIYSATPEDFSMGMAAFYERVLHSLQPGINEIVVHLAENGAEMNGMTGGRADWGAAWRQADFDFFNSAACRTILREEKIQLLTFREIGKLLK